MSFSGVIREESRSSYGLISVGYTKAFSRRIPIGAISRPKVNVSSTPICTWCLSTRLTCRIGLLKSLRKLLIVLRLTVFFSICPDIRSIIHTKANTTALTRMTTIKNALPTTVMGWRCRQKKTKLMPFFRNT